MKFEVINGTDRIGGSIVKIFGEKEAILIDLGNSLDGRILSDDILEHALENVKDIFITHYHTDHVDLLNHPLLENKNIHLSGFTKKILENKGIVNYCNYYIFEQNDTIVIDNLTIRPFKSDHSASDSYMFLISNGDKTILHTGDFRMRGVEYNKIIDELYTSDIKIDLLMIDGTYYGYDYDFKSEFELKRYFEKAFIDNQYNFVFVPTTNFARMKIISDSAKVTGHTVYMDNYVYKNYKEIYEPTNIKILREMNIDKFRKEEFVMIFSPNNFFKEFYTCFNQAKRSLIYSAWPGYLNKKYKKIYDFFVDQIFTYIHTAGHSNTKDIDEFIDIVKPNLILPLHTETKNEFIDKYKNTLDIYDLMEYEI